MPRRRPRPSSPRASRPAKPFIRQLCEAQAELASRAKGDPRVPGVPADYQDDAYAAVEAGRSPRQLAQALTIADKQEREARLDAINELAEQLAEQFEGRAKEISPPCAR